MLEQHTTVEHHWLPFTHNRHFKHEPRLFVKAKGHYYWDQNQRPILDGCSGLFCTPAGHGRTEIAQAITKQLDTLDYTSSFQVSHPLAETLAKKIAKWTPRPLNRIFFTCSGSEAIDTSMKMVMAYHLARGEGERNYFVSRQRAYHGVNLGGTSLAGISKNRQQFPQLLPHVLHLSATGQQGQAFLRGQADSGWELADELEQMVKLLGKNRIAACYIEPIAGSTGVLIPPRAYLQRLREICNHYGILLVFDEVICGFGRTGKAFAAESFDVTPDIITMAKALTNGVQPMGAVAVKESIYETIVSQSPEETIEFFHGYTYSAHPLACAAACATLELYEKEGLFARAAELSPYFLDKIFALQELKAISGIRGYGLLAGIDLKPQANLGLSGAQASQKLFQAGVHVKFTGDTFLVAPAFTYSQQDIDQLCGLIQQALCDL